MRTYILDIVSKITSFSKELNNKNLIINKKWILINDTDEKNVFIFRDGNQLLISKNGIINKSSWEYITNDIISIEIDSINYLFTPSFIDENLFILELDGKNEYVIFIEEMNFKKYINSSQKVSDFINNEYDKKNEDVLFQSSIVNNEPKVIVNKIYTTDNIEIEIHTLLLNGYTKGDKVYINGQPAPNGKYKIGWMDYLNVFDGKIKSL